MAVPGACDACFVTRDNWRHTTDIKKHYLAAIRTARRRVVIADAYFFPGYRLIRALMAKRLRVPIETGCRPVGTDDLLESSLWRVVRSFVFIALLGHELPPGRLLGTLRAYRAIYYLLPLLVATVFYVVTELHARRRRRDAAARG